MLSRLTRFNKTTTFARGAITVLGSMLLFPIALAAQSKPSGNSRIVPVRTGTDLASFASPDGRFIAIILMGQTWLVPSTGGTARALTDVISEPRVDVALAWAPDGRRLSVLSNTTMFGPRTALDVVDVETGTSMRVASAPNIVSAMWSHDGSRLLVSLFEEDSISLTAYRPVPNARGERLSRLPGAPVSLRRSATGEMAYATVDGRRTLGSLGGLREYLTASGQVRPLSSDSITASLPAYSPDGELVAFIAEASGEREVWVRSLRTGAERPVTSGVDEIYLAPVSWLSPSRVLFTAHGQLQVASLDRSVIDTIPFVANVPVTRAENLRALRLPTPGDRRKVQALVDPQLSPDGRTVVFAALGDLWCAPVDGGAVRRLTNSPIDERRPVWSPDGARIAYYATRENGGTQLRVLSLAHPDSSRAIPVDSSVAFARPRIVWSPDSRAIAFANGRLIQRLDLDDGATRTIAVSPVPYVEAVVAWSPQDSVAYIASRLTGSTLNPGGWQNVLWVVSSDSGVARTLDVPRERLSRAGISGQLRRVAYNYRGIGHHALLADTTTANRIADPSPRSFSWSADGSRLLYSSNGRLRLLEVHRGRAQDVRIDLDYRVSPAPRPIQIRNVRIIDGTGRQRSAPSDVLIANGRIRSMSLTGRRPVAPDVDVIDGTGLTLLPGLIDSHVHSFGWRGFASSVYFGVLAARDPGDVTEWLRSQRERAAAGLSLAPRLFYAGRVMDDWGQPFADGRFVDVRSAERVDEAVGSIAADEADFIKPYFWDPVQDAHVIDAAHRRGIRVGSHFSLLSSLARGLDYKEHATTYSLDWTSTYQDDLIATLRAANTCVVPTLQLYATSRGQTSTVVPHDPSIFADTLLAELYRPRDLALARALAQANMTEAMRALWMPRERRDYESMRRLAAAGVRVTIGTDATETSGPWRDMGVHLEMERFVRGVGMTPLEAIRAATLIAAQCLGVDGDLGSVEVGKVADLLLVEGDPSSDIRDTRRIRSVILGGAVWERAEILAAIRGERP